MRGMAGPLVDVLHHPEHGAASFGGLVTCGNAWVCPVCSAKILNRRAEEIGRAATSWQERGGRLAMLTLTLRHERDIPLSVYLNGLNEAYRLLRGGRAWQAFRKRFGLVGTITRREITHGRAGWHPHLHALLFLDGKTARTDLEEIAKYLKKRWIDVLHKLGFDATEENGVDIREANEGAAPYMAKMTSLWSVSKEISSSDTKKALHGNKTIAQILLHAELGEAREVSLFREYAAAVYGKAVIVWSRGLRSQTLPEETEKTDEELANEHQADAVPLVALTRDQWREICRRELRGQLLDVAAAGDVFLVCSFLNRQALGCLPWQVGLRSRGGGPPG